jgi:hypothetical protein
MKTIRLFAIMLTFLTMSGCIAILRPCDGSSYPSMSRESLVRKVTLAEVKRSWLAELELGTLPPEAQAGGIKWVDDARDKFYAKTLPTDDLWTYRFEKCAGCGWYTEGVVALRESCIAAELTTKDDM